MLTGNPDIDEAISKSAYFLTYAIGYLYRLYLSFSTNYEEAYRLIMACLLLYIAFTTVLSTIRFFFRWSKFAVKSAVLAYIISIAVSYFTGQSLYVMAANNPIIQELSLIYDQVRVVIGLAYAMYNRMLMNGDLELPSYEYYEAYFRNR